ncbi:hypothetical protein ABEB36_003725 [Hypothenemus hampei]|uniref:Kinesin-like protein n=1 Tax=Hypothenemus hampei TaxID=57062 RepID=A0ABD1F0W9_HYPHA
MNESIDIETGLENVKVYIRICPLQSNKICGNIEFMNQQAIKLCKSVGLNDEKLFQFDRVFQAETTQMDLYQIVAAPLVDRALCGYSGTIFAYGQSGTGKTYTILGDAENRGIVPNMFSHLLTRISLADSQSAYLLTVTFLEIYNEQVRDLLNNNSNTNLEVRESPELGVYVKNLSGVTVESEAQIQELITQGSKNRVIGSTNLNEQSSRSHTIFGIRIEAKQEDGSTTFGKLNLVDLAGSERVSKSLVSGVRLREAVKINLSLSVLGNVISALVDRTSTFIPYRNSKLTRLLKESLGGNCLTSMIATIRPEMENIEETYYTLMYADRAKKIQNCVKKNKENNTVLQSFENKIKELQKQLEELEGCKGKKLNRKTKECKSEILEHLQNEKTKLLDKIHVLQKKILVGGENLIEKVQIQKNIMDSNIVQLKILDSSHQLLQETLENKTSEKTIFQRKSSSLQEEDKLLNFQIEEVERKIAKAEKLLYRKESEYQNEISNLLYTNKCLARDLGLTEYIMYKTIDKADMDYIKRNMFWDGDMQEYRVKSIAHCGNNLKKINLNIENNVLVNVNISNYYKDYP